MNSPNTNRNTGLGPQSSKELLKEVRQDIQKVKDDIDKIKTRMTPGQIIDDVIYHNQGRNPAATFDLLKSNPVGTTFLTVGTLLLMENDKAMTYESLVRTKGKVVLDQTIARKDKLVANVNEVKENISSKLHSKKPTVSTPGRGYGADFDSITNSAKSTLGSALDSAKNYVAQNKDSWIAQAKEGSEHAEEVISGKAHEVYEASRHLDPLTYMALGAGLGTLTGAALPVSESEKNFVNQAMEGKITDFKRDLQAALNQSVNIIKNEFIHDFTDLDVNIFKNLTSEQQRPNV